MSEPQQGIYGIDLGTTYSVVGYIDETGRPAVTRNSDGQDTTPSVVYFESRRQHRRRARWPRKRPGCTRTRSCR